MGTLCRESRSSEADDHGFELRQQSQIMLEGFGMDSGNIRNRWDDEMDIELLESEIDHFGSGVAVDADALIAQAGFHETTGGAGFVGDEDGELGAGVLHFFHLAGEVGLVAGAGDADAFGGEGVGLAGREERRVGSAERFGRRLELGGQWAEGDFGFEISDGSDRSDRSGA